MLADPLQHVDEVVVGVNVMQPAGGHQTLHDTDMLRAEFSPGEHPGLATHRDGAQRTLEMVGVDLHVRNRSIGSLIEMAKNIIEI